MAANGRNPASAIFGKSVLYQGKDGIARGTFDVRLCNNIPGGNLTARTAPPNVSGTVMVVHKRRMITIVPKGNAAVDCIGSMKRV